MARGLLDTRQAQPEESSLPQSEPAIRFLLNGQLCAVSDVPPTTTLLDWLRETACLKGTKEGCAEGDCGACTVALGEPDDDGRGIRWQAANSCLLMLPQVHGRAVLTVEGLAAPGDSLAPVQQALVDADASQCGFCTPGFVMAMFAFQQGGEEADDATIHEALAGNLCRCTGYRPIVEATRRACAQPDDTFAGHSQGWCRTLAGLPGAPAYAVGAQHFLSPLLLDELVVLRAAHPDALLLAGGTDLGLLVSKERRPLPMVISTSRVAELNRLTLTDSHLEIGAAVTYSRALPAIDEAFPCFGALIRRIGSRQIRNLGTIGGNCANASPIGDTPPCLIALEATMMVAGPRGRRAIHADVFFTDYRQTALAPDEVLVSVRLPLLQNDQAFHCYKVSKRHDQDISAVIGAYRLTFDGPAVGDARIAYGGMAATPKRAAQAEAALRGRPWTAETIAIATQALSEDFQPISDFRASAGYRLTVAGNLIRRLFIETTAPETPLEVMAL